MKNIDLSNSILYNLITKYLSLEHNIQSMCNQKQWATLNLMGRKIKYLTDEGRIENRREQNRLNQRKFRMKKRFYSKSTELSPEQNNLKYIDNIVKYFSQYEYDYHLVGTSSIKNHTMNSLYDYTKKLMEKLCKDGLTERSLFFIEGGDGIHFHYHILLKSLDILNFKKYWKTGILKTKEIDNELHKHNLLKYSMKEFKVDTKSVLELKKIDYWDFCGNY